MPGTAQGKVLYITSVWAVPGTFPSWQICGRRTVLSIELLMSIQEAYPPLLVKLTGGDRRSIGRSAEVVADVLADPARFAVLFQGLLVDDALVRMRAADALEKITVHHPEYLAPYTAQLLQEVGPLAQQEVRWHVAQLLSRLALTAEERRTAVNLLNTYLQDQSKIVKTFAMQALADIALVDAELRPQIIAQLETLTAAGSPAMRSRGKKLLAKLTASAASRAEQAVSPALTAPDCQ